MRFVIVHQRAVATGETVTESVTKAAMLRTLSKCDTRIERGI